VHDLPAALNRFQHDMTAKGTCFVDGLIPACKMTFRIMGTAIKSPSCLGFSYNQIMTAERAGDANFFVIRFRVAASRHTRAGKDFP